MVAQLDLSKEAGAGGAAGWRKHLEFPAGGDQREKPGGEQ